LGRFGQRPELSQATGMALVRCILDKFLGVGCHCYPPRFLDVPTFATRCLPASWRTHVRHDARDPSGGRWNCGRECCSVILPKRRLPRHIGIFYVPQIYDMGPTALLPLRKNACWGFFAPKNTGLNPGTWVLKASTLSLDHRSRCRDPTECEIRISINIVYCISQIPLFSPVVVGSSK
jgi:hypothetical protein